MVGGAVAVEEEGGGLRSVGKPGELCVGQVGPLVGDAVAVGEEGGEVRLVGAPWVDPAGGVAAAVGGAQLDSNFVQEQGVVLVFHRPCSIDWDREQVR